LSRSNW